MFGEEDLTDTYYPKVDYKGRVTLPHESKVEVGDTLIVFEWKNGYRIYNSKRFYQIFDSLITGLYTETRQKVRYIFGRAEDFTITSLPPRVTIKKFANKTIKLIGRGDYYLAEEHEKGYR